MVKCFTCGPYRVALIKSADARPVALDDELSGTETRENSKRLAESWMHLDVRMMLWNSAGSDVSAERMIPMSDLMMSEGGSEEKKAYDPAPPGGGLLDTPFC